MILSLRSSHLFRYNNAIIAIGFVNSLLMADLSLLFQLLERPRILRERPRIRDGAHITFGKRVDLRHCDPDSSQAWSIQREIADPPIPRCRKLPLGGKRGQVVKLDCTSLT